VQVTVGTGVEGPLAVKPNVVLAPGAKLPLYDMLVTVTLPPLTVRLPFHRLLMLCPLGRVQCTVQLLVAAVVELLATVTVTWKPPVQLLVTL
jgi:hypothetical protein